MEHTTILLYYLSLTSIIFKVKVAYFIEELKTLSERLYHFYAAFALLNCGIIFAQDLLQVDVVVVKGSYKLSLCHVLCLVHEEGHDSFGNHVIHALPDRVEVRDDQALDNVSLQLRAG